MLAEIVEGLVICSLDGGWIPGGCGILRFTSVPMFFASVPPLLPNTLPRSTLRASLTVRASSQHSWSIETAAGGFVSQALIITKDLRAGRPNKRPIFRETVNRDGESDATQA